MTVTGDENQKIEVTYFLKDGDDWVSVHVITLPRNALDQIEE